MATQLPIRQNAELQRRKLNAAIEDITTAQTAITTLQARNTAVGAALPGTVPADGVLFVVEGPPAELHVAITGVWVQLV